MKKILTVKQEASIHDKSNNLVEVKSGSDCWLIPLTIGDPITAEERERLFSKNREPDYHHLANRAVNHRH